MKLFRRDEHDKLRVRRHIALFCLALNVAVVVVLLAAIFLGPPDRDEVISAIAQVLLAVLALTGGFTGAWFHSAYKADKEQR